MDTRWVRDSLKGAVIGIFVAYLSWATAQALIPSPSPGGCSTRWFERWLASWEAAVPPVAIAGMVGVWLGSPVWTAAALLAGAVAGLGMHGGLYPWGFTSIRIGAAAGGCVALGWSHRFRANDPRIASGLARGTDGAPAYRSSRLPLIAMALGGCVGCGLVIWSTNAWDLAPGAKYPELIVTPMLIAVALAGGLGLLALRNHRRSGGHVLGLVVAALILRQGWLVAAPVRQLGGAAREERLRGLAALADLGPRGWSAAPWLLAGSRDADAVVRGRALDVMRASVAFWPATYGAAAYQAMTAVEPQVRANALGLWVDTGSTAPAGMVRALAIIRSHDVDLDARRSAVDALVLRAYNADVPTPARLVAPLLDDPDESIARAGARLLRWTRPGDTARVIHALQATSVVTRRAAAAAMRCIEAPNEPARIALEQVVADPDPTLHDEATVALRCLDPGDAARETCRDECRRSPRMSRMEARLSESAMNAALIGGSLADDAAGLPGPGLVTALIAIVVLRRSAASDGTRGGDRLGRVVVRRSRRALGSATA